MATRPSSDTFTLAGSAPGFYTLEPNADGSVDVYSSRKAEDITSQLSDTVNLTNGEAWLYSGSGGDIKVICADDTVAVTFKYWPAGTILPVKVIRVFTSVTSATNLLALR